MKKKVNILGTEYRVTMKKYSDDPEFGERSISGYCDGELKEIVLCDMATWPGWDKENVRRRDALHKQVLRHEIVHAFLCESGLDDSSLAYSGGWARNEEMVDWFASQGSKIYKAWRDMKCEL